MTGLLDALLAGAGLSVLAAMAAWLLGHGLRNRMHGAEVAVWRTARLVALLPLVLAPLIYLVPQTAAAPVGLELSMATPVPSYPAMAAAADMPAPPVPLPSLPVLLGLAYCAGLVLALLFAATRHIARNRLLARTRPASPQERRPLEALAGRIGVRAPEMRVGPAGVTPFLTGWRGIVIVPQDLVEQRDTLHYALIHELCHLRRGDERDRLVGAALIAVNWFNWPLRQIERELNAAREIACDRDALNALGGAQRKAYAAALIDMMRSAAPAVSAFGPSNRRHREMRIKAIMTAPAARRGRAVWLAATILASAVPIAGAQALVTERRTVSEPVEAVTPAPDRQFSDVRGEQVLSAQQAQRDAEWEQSIAQLTPVIASPEGTPYERAIALQLRGRAHYELADIDAAIADWRAAIDTDGMTGVEVMNLRLNIGQLQIAEGDMSAGLATLERATAGREPGLGVSRIMAQAYAQAGQFEAGLPLARSVYDADPQDERHLNLMIYYLQELGRTDELAALVGAHDAAPDMPKANRDGELAPAPEAAPEPHAEPHAAPHPEVHAEPHAAHTAPVAPEPDAMSFGRAVREPAPTPDAAPGAEHSFGPAAAPALSLTHRVAHGRISSRYGNRPARPADAPVFHHGVDIAAERGTPIVAPGAGVIVHAAAGFRGEAAWGNTVAIDHGNGWQTVYAHMEGFDVALGDHVSPGQQIGRVGSTGRSTGPHVHVELHHDGERLDPAGVVPGL